MGLSSVVKEVTDEEVKELKTILIDYEEAMQGLQKATLETGQNNYLSGRIGRAVQIIKAQGTEILEEARGAIYGGLSLSMFRELDEEETDLILGVVSLKPKSLANIIGKITFAINDSLPKGGESNDVNRAMFQLRNARLNQIRNTLVTNGKSAILTSRR